MADNFEDRLRQSLQARSEDVTPDPAMYREVQRRIRRGRMARWSLASAGAVAMVAIAALVVPSVLDRRIEFEPAPVATQPPSEAVTPAPATPSSGAMPVPSGMVSTDGSALYAMALDGESASALFGGPPCEGEACGDPIHDVAVRPGSSHQNVTSAYTLNDGCHSVVWHSADLRDEETSTSSGLLDDAGCAGAPAFSPDARHSAWPSAVGPDGRWMLSTVDWTDDGPGADDASFDLGWGGGVTEVTIEDWVWTRAGEEGAQGYLVLAARIGEHVETHQRFITRQADGALSLTADSPVPMGGQNGATPVAFSDAEAAVGGARVTYTIDTFTDGADATQGRLVRRLGEREAGTFDLPPELFNSTNPPFNPSDLWLEAMGDTVLYGNGHGMAWRLVWNGSDWDGPFLLEATVVHAEMFSSAGLQPEPASPPRTMAQVDVHFVTPEGACGEQAAVFQRSVEGSGVLRGALEHLLAGPTPEEIAAGASDQTGFGPETAGYLNDLSIDSDGLARIDFDARLAERFPSSACGSGALLSMLDPTVRQFPSVTGIIYSFGGNVDAFYNHFQLASPPHGTDVPRAVVRTRDMIRDAVSAAREDDNWDPLAELIDRETFSCSFSDQNEDCIALWQQQEAEGQDPLGPLAEILQGQPAKVDGAPIWAWPFAFVATDEYLGPRTGIQRNGTWRYYQQGGD